MTKRKRKSREVIAEQGISLVEPFDITKFGSDEDPCFGKLNDPKAPECKLCGDFEFCAIVMAESLKSRRVKEEAKTEYKDLSGTPDLEQVRQFMAKKLDKHSKPKIIALAVKKFGISKVKAKTIFKNV